MSRNRRPFRPVSPEWSAKAQAADAVTSIGNAVALGATRQPEMDTFWLLYMKHPWVASCVDLIANTIAADGYALQPTSKEANAQDTRVEEIELFFDGSFDGRSFRSSMFATAADMDIFGRAFWRKQRVRGQCIGFERLDPRLVFPKPNADRTEIAAFLLRRRVAGIAPDADVSLTTPETIDPKDIVFFKREGGDALIGGPSPLEHLDLTIAIDFAIRRHREAFFRNGATTGKILSNTKANREQIRMAEEMIRGTKTGPENAYQTWLLAGEWVIEDRGDKAGEKDVDFPKGSAINREEVCFVPGTLIVTEAGVRPIESIRVGDRVLSHTGAYRPVTATMARAFNGSVFTVQAKALDAVTATGNHPFLVQRVGTNRSHKLLPIGAPAWRELESVAARRRQRDGAFARGVFDALVLPRVKPMGNQQIDLADHVRKSAEVEPSFVRASTNGRAVRVPRFLAQDENLGYLIGLYASDGSVTDHQAIWYLGTHEKSARIRLVAAIKATFNLEPAVAVNGSVTRVTLSNRMVADFLAQIGHVAHEKRLPPWALEGSEEMRSGILDGLIDGDGCTKVPGYVRFSSTSLDLVWQLRLLLAACGVQTASPAVRESGEWKIDGRSGACRKSWSLQWRSAGSAAPLVGEEYLAATVTRIERTNYAGLVYNLSVDVDESYVTTGGTVHNCAVYHVPVGKLAFSANALGSSGKAEDDATFQEQCVLPREELLYETISQQVLKSEFGIDDLKMIPKRRHSLRLDMFEAAQKIVTFGGTGNDARELVNLPRFEESGVSMDIPLFLTHTGMTVADDEPTTTTGDASQVESANAKQDEVAQKGAKRFWY
jgi:hypothetical protein